MALLNLSKEEREELAKQICSQLDTVDSALEGLEVRWEVNEAYYRNHPGLLGKEWEENEDGTALVRVWGGEDWAPCSLHAPLVQPICDSIADNIGNVVLGQTNFCTAKAYGASAQHSTKLTEEVQWHFSNAIADDRIQQAAEWCAVLNMAVMRVRFNLVAKDFLPENVAADVTAPGEIAFAGVELDCIHPRDFRAYPHDVSDVTQCRLLAHRWRKMHTSEIEELQEIGRFYKNEREFVETAPEDEGLAASEKIFDKTETLRDRTDTFPTLWTGLFKAKLGKTHECWYEFTVARESCELLSVKEYELSRPWYVPFYLKQEYGSIYPSNSTAQNIQQLQTAFNELFSQVVDGAALGTYPMFLTNNNGLPENQIEKWEPLKIVPVVGDPKEAVNQLGLNANLAPLMEAMARIQDLAERTARVSSNDMGTSFQGSMTATESAQIAQGSATKKNAMLNSFSMALTQVWSLGQQLLALNYQWVQQAYGDATPLSGDEMASEIMATPVKWEVTGKNAASTPEQQFQAASMLLQTGVSLAQMGLPLFRLEQLGNIMAETSQLPGSSAILISDDERKQIDSARASIEASQQPGMEGDPGSGGGIGGEGAAGVGEFGGQPAY